MAALRDPQSGSASCIWLHTTERDMVPALSVLSDQLRASNAPPKILLTAPGRASGPEPDDARAIDAFLTDNGVRLLVLAGAILPLALIERARARQLGLMLVDARHPVMPKRWRFLSGNLRSTLAKFDQIHAQDAASATAIQRLVRGAVEVHDTGRLARYGPAPGCNEFELSALREAIGTRPVWFAYDLPAIEADAAFLAHSYALRRAHRLLMILQPRDPASGPALAERARDLGFTCARRAVDDDIDENTQVYIADSEDNPGLFLRLAPVSFLGGSLTPDVGQPSAVAAAALGSALIYGPCASVGQREFLGRLGALGGGRPIGVAAALGEALAALLAPDAGAEAALRAWTLATDGSDATNTVTRAILDWLQLNRGRE